MSISTEITRLQTLRNNIRTKLISLGMLSNSSASLNDCYTALNGVNKKTSITKVGGKVTADAGYYPDSVYQIVTASDVAVGNINITNTSSTNVANYATAKVVDANLVAGNIKNGVNILGVAGTYTASGGGSNAFILVNSTSGATLTCGSDTYTLGANETSHAFGVELGTYTVTASKSGTISKSKTVMVSTETVHVVNIPVSQVPDGYQEVEYIQSTGVQYINTDIIPTSSTYAQIKFKFIYPYGVETYPTVLGSYTGSSAWRILYARGYDKWYTEGFDVVPKEMNSINIGTTNNSVTPPSLPICLFVQKETNQIAGKAICQIYYLKIGTDSEHITYNFIPCYRISDSVAGLYDTINDVFYTNDGTDSFIVGGDV